MQPTPIFTPTPSPAELTKQVGELVSIWNTLTPIMAVLFVVLVALGIVGLFLWINRNNSSTAINVIANSNAQKDKEIIELRAQREQDRKQNTENMTLLSQQFTRSNDLFEAMNNRGGERDKQQQRMVESQAQIASDLKVMVTSGSAPVQEIRTRVNEIVGIVSTIDGRTADWNGILSIITPLLIELGALRTEAKKHSTQPIPVIDPVPPANGEANPL